MKMQKYFYKLTVLILVSVMLACNQDDESLAPIAGYSEIGMKCIKNNYVLDEGLRACVCPLETHFALEKLEGDESTSLPHCIEKKENNYFYTADKKTCMYEVTLINSVGPEYENVYDGIGSASINFEWPSIAFDIGTGTHGQQPNNNVVGDTQSDDVEGITYNPDGSFNIHLKGLGNLERRCEDWAERNPRCLAWRTETFGKSNADRTEVDLTIIWRDCDQVVVDTGRIHMWREW